MVTYDLAACQVCSVPCYCGDMPRLNCANYNFATVPSPPYPLNTTVVNMQVNKIQKVGYNAFGNLTKLLILRMDQNEIDDVAPKAFYGLPNLNELQLSYNKISSLPDTIVETSAPLADGIKLQYNNVTTFPLAFLLNTQRIVNLHNNPIHCDCFSIIPNELKDKVRGTCISPLNLTGRAISNITAKEVNCEVCSDKSCENGICYTQDGVTPKCSCFEGFPKCKLKVHASSRHKVPTSPSDINATLNFPSGANLYRIMKTFGEPLLIKGCEVSSRSRLPVNAKLYWLQEQSVFLPSGVKKVVNSTDSYKYTMEDLLIQKTNFSSEGIYQCCLKIGNSTITSSDITYVQFEGERSLWRRISIRI